MNLRIQTYGTFSLVVRGLIVGDEGKTAVDALEKGLDDLMALCAVVEDKFQSALEEKNNKMEMD
jgi:DNA-directed RNA polymerase subunit L